MAELVAIIFDAARSVVADLGVNETFRRVEAEMMIAGGGARRG
jgi:hypothetical protein